VKDGRWTKVWKGELMRMDFGVIDMLKISCKDRFIERSGNEFR